MIQGKNDSEEYGTHNLSFQAMYKYFKKIGNNGISSQESDGLSNEAIKSPDNTLAWRLIYSGKRMYVKCNRSCLK